MSPVTIVDPRTESAQICGRFRNGVQWIDHITNIDSRLHYYTEIATKKILQAEEEFYFAVKDIPLPSDVNIIHEKNKALQALRYHSFVTEKGERNYFMWDNECYEQLTRKTYTAAENLERAYLNRFKPELIIKTQKSENEHLNSPNSWELVIENLNIHKAKENHDYKKYCNNLKSLGLDEMYKAYELLGATRIRTLNYDYKQIKAEIKTKSQQAQYIIPEIKEALYKRFNVGETIPIAEMTDFIKELFEHHHIDFKGKRIDSKIVSLFFDLEKKKIDRSSKRAYLLKEKLL